MKIVGNSSFRLQLMYRYASSFGVLLLLMAAVTYFSLSHCLMQSLDRGLLVIAQSEADFATQNAQLHLHNTHAVLPGQGNYSLPRYVQISDLQGHILVSNHHMKPSPIQLSAILLQANQKQQTIFSKTEIQNESYRLLYLPIQQKGRDYSLQVATPMDSVNETLNQVMSLFLWAGLGIWLLACYLGWHLAARAVAPLQQIASISAQINLQGLHKRLPEREHSPQELKDLSQKLNQMLERLDHSTQVLKQFTADASHELRTPLTILKSELQIALRKERSPQEYRALLASNLEEVERLIELAEVLLRLAHSEQIIEAEQLLNGQSNLLERIHHMATRWQDAATAKTVSLEIFAPTTDNWQINVHHTYLEQILYNLIDNALKVSPEGSQLKLELVRSEDQIGFAIQDEGPGVKAEQQALIFQRFYQTEASHTSNRKHFGIGLSLCQILVEAHQGIIHVHSSPGQGSRFCVMFPLTSAGMPTLIATGTTPSKNE